LQKQRVEWDRWLRHLGQRAEHICRLQPVSACKAAVAGTTAGAVILAAGMVFGLLVLS
jgi:hypothetical protein